MRFRTDSQRRAVFANIFSKADNVSRGKRFEQKIHARVGGSNCIVTMRSTGSRGLWDIACITPDKVRLIQAKTHGYLKPSDREEMLGQLQTMPDNVQAELEYYVSPRVRKKFILKKAGEKDWDKVKERLDYFSEVRGYRKGGPDAEDENEFSLYVKYDPKVKMNFVKSDEYPEVSFLLQGFGMRPKNALDYLKDIPDEDLVGLKRVDVFTPQQFRKHLPNSIETSGYIDRFVTETEWSPMINLNVKGGRKQAVHDAMHEVGHHVDLEDRPHKGDWSLIKNIVYDLPADSYVKMINPADKRVRTSEWLDERAEEMRGLSDTKALTFDEAKKYAGVSDEV